jgi:hypothetical protein
MTLAITSLITMFILSCFASTKKLIAVLALVTLFYIHLPVAIGLTVILAAFFYYFA